MRTLVIKAVHAAWKLIDLLYLLDVRWNIREVGNGVRVLGFPILQKFRGSRIRLGDRVVLCSRGANTALGVSRPVIFRTLSPTAEILVGADTGMSGTTICAATSIRIGDSCLFGADVMVVDTDFHPISPEGRRYSEKGIASAPIRIGNNVFIGARTLILKGVSIGDNSVVGAGSIVTRDIPANAIAAGNPAKVIGHC